ncbi:MAG: RDD family protein [Bacilli bacterium]
MNKSHAFYRAYLPKRMLGKLIDLSLIALTTYVFYSLVFMMCFGSFSNLKNNTKVIEEKQIEYRLNVTSSTPNYAPYKEALEYVFFDKLYEEIYQKSNESRPADDHVSVEYLYNVNILHLPATPDSTNYQTDYFSYQVNEKNEPLLDKVGTIRVDNIITPVGKHNLFDIFEVGYSKLQNVALAFDETYGNAFKDNIYLRQTAIVSSFFISVFIYMILIPLLSKTGVSLGYKMLSIGIVNSKDGEVIAKYKSLYRLLPIFIIVGVGLYYFNLYSISLLVVLPIFIELLYMTLSRGQHDLSNIISCSEDIDLAAKEDESLSDPEFSNMLSHIASVNVGENHE